MHRTLKVASILLICVLAGCGENRPATYPTRGTVAFENGTPVRTGTIELLSDDFQTTATGRINDDGSFVLGTFTPNDGACAGTHKAVIVQLIVNDGITVHTRDHGSAIDPKYSSYDTTDLAVTIEPVERNDVELIVDRRPD